MSDNSAKGHCICGAVSFEARNVPRTFGVCHCKTCRRWSGSAFLEVSVPTEDVVWHGSEHIAVRTTSDWGERAWCRECGTGLYFRVTQDGPFFGNFDIALGIFDDPAGFTMTHEIFIDHKPDSFAFAGSDRALLTRQNCVEKFGALDTN
jgi:hypothetical protein